MSRKNAKLVKISDLQCKQSDVILTKNDLSLIVQGLRSLDKSQFTERKCKELEVLTLYFSKITYSK